MTEQTNEIQTMPVNPIEKPRKKRAWLSFLFILVIVILSFYFALNIYQAKLDKQNKDLMQAVIALQNDNQTLHQQLNTQQANLQAMQAAQENTINTLQASTLPMLSVHRMNLQAAYMNIQLGYWMFQHQEPTTLISKQLDLAKQNLKYAGASGQSLVASLDDLNDKLNSLPRVDINQVLTQMVALQASFANLNFKPVAVINTNSNQTAQAPGHLNWRQSLAYSLVQLKSQLIIQTNDQVGNELVSQASRVDAIRTLNLDLAVAKWYAITNNPNYTESLNQLVLDIQQYTAQNSAQTNSLNQALALQNLPISYSSNQLQDMNAGFNHLMEAIDRANQ
jgi:hypothetical protein